MCGASFVCGVCTRSLATCVSLLTHKNVIEEKKDGETTYIEIHTYLHTQVG